MHKENEFTIVGVLAPTGTPNDRALFINMEGFYLIEDHAKDPAEEHGEHAEHGDEDEHHKQHAHDEDDHDDDQDRKRRHVQKLAGLEGS